MTVVHVSKACGPSCLDKVMKMKDHSTKYESDLNLDLTLKVLKLMRLKMYTKAAILKLIGSGQVYPTEPLDKIPALHTEFEPRRGRWGTGIYGL